MCTKKYVISGLAVYQLNRHVVLEVNGVMYDFIYENGSHASKMWYYICVTGSSVHCFDYYLSSFMCTKSATATNSIYHLFGPVQPIFYENWDWSLR